MSKPCNPIPLVVSTNFASDPEAAAFGTNHQRLVDLKNKYDPQNLFRMNQNIKPTV